MADLYGTASSPAAETEEISSFLHQLLHNSSSSSSSSSASKFMHHHTLLTSPSLPPPQQADNSSPAELFFGAFNYSDQGGYYRKESGENALCSKRASVSAENDHHVGDVSCCDSEKGGGGDEVAEVPPETTARPSNSSSKRSRAAEVHNLSEKRRRSRINEKMKALQNLIPNSNKTDKASMLDEAIEYLKQLQLQVQMLTMKNGLSLHPMCLPGVLQSMQLPLTGISFDEGGGLLNSNAATGAFSENAENSAQTALSLPNRCTISNQPIVLPSATDVTTSETPFSFEPLIQAHYETPFNLSTSSKDICREGTAQTPLDTNQTVKTTSSSVS